MKRTADQCVRQGLDINTPLKLFEIVGPRLQSVKMWYINEEDFHQSAELMPSAIPVLKGTRDIHQVISEKSGIIAHRKLSCFCNWHESSGKSCECYNPRTFGYVKLLRPTHSFTDIDSEVQPEASLPKLADPDSEVHSESQSPYSIKFHTDEKKEETRRIVQPKI